MSNGQTVYVDSGAIARGVSIGLAPQFNELIAEMKNVETEVQQVNRELARLRSRIAELEFAKAEVMKNASEKFQSELANTMDEMDVQFKDEFNILQGAYDRDIIKLIENLMENIRVEMGSLERLDKSYRQAIGPLDGFKGDLKVIQEMRINNYLRRLNSLLELKTDIMSNLEEFQKERKKTIEFIENLQISKTPTSKGVTILHIPFWIIGIENDNGGKLHILPPMMVSTSPRPEPPQRLFGYYWKSLQSHKKYRFEEFYDSLDCEGIFQLAQEKSILGSMTSDSLEQRLEILYSKNILDHSQSDGKSFFIEVYKKFINSMKGGPKQQYNSYQKEIFDEKSQENENWKQEKSYDKTSYGQLSQGRFSHGQ